MLFDKLITSKVFVTSDGSFKVIGFYYGQADKKSKDTSLNKTTSKQPETSNNSNLSFAYAADIFKELNKKTNDAINKQSTDSLFIKPIIEIDIPKQTTLFVFTNNKQCKYIAGEANGIETRVCGNRTIEGTSWCFEHHALVYIKPPVLNMKGQLHHG